VYRYRIVGPDIDADRVLSGLNPYGESIVSMTEGEEVIMHRPDSTASFVVISICYEKQGCKKVDKYLGTEKIRWQP